MREQNSSAEYPTDLVLAACNRALESIRSSRRRKQLKLAEEKMHRSNWWRKLFFMKPIDIVQAEEKYKHAGDIFNPYFMVCFLHGGQETVACRLKNLCEKTPSKIVTVTASDFDYIESYYEAQSQ
jgi:hypothetical protein